MAIIRWEPARRPYTVHGDIGRLFESFFDTPTRAGASRPQRWVPALDVVEQESEYVLRADLPGLSQEEIGIELDDNVLTITGERKHETEQRQQGYYRLERSFGRFSRSLALPEGVDADAITAGYEDGVLEVKVPKPEQRRPRKVAIKLAGEQPAIAGGEG